MITIHESTTPVLATLQRIMHLPHTILFRRVYSLVRVYSVVVVRCVLSVHLFNSIQFIWSSHQTIKQTPTKPFITQNPSQHYILVKMPLWLIYHPPTIFTSAKTKQTLAASITEIYLAAGLPAFYVNVLFQPVEAESFYIGGVARPTKGEGEIHERPFVRITIQHLARQL